MNYSYPAFERPAQRGQNRPRVVVVAPHPDDDILGCGGTLLRLAARGARINVVYVTDGSASHLRSKKFPPAVLRYVREAEARDALRVLGISTRPRFLRAPDGRLANLEANESHALVVQIAHAIDRLRPQLLFAPWRRDPHPDHIATAALVDAARGLSRRRPATYFYRVWLPVRGTAADEPMPAETRVRNVALTPAQIERKREAIMQHRSQTTGLVDDDPEGFRIDMSMLDQWLQPSERFYCSDRTRCP